MTTLESGKRTVNLHGIDSLSAVDTRYGARIAATRFTVSESPLRGASETPDDSIRDSVDLSGAASAFMAAPYSYAPPGLSAADSKSGDAPDETGGDDRIDEQPGEEEEESSRKAGEETDARGQPLDEREQRQVRKLKDRDQEVRTHERAHKAVGGRYAGGVSYEYQQGPDGNRYAVGGEVSIDVSSEGDPDATIAKMRQVRAAAMAPADPSPQDHSVAAQASRTEMQARQEVREQDAAGGEGGEGEEGGGAEAASEGTAAADEAEPSRSTRNPYIEAYSNPSGRFSLPASSAAGGSRLDVVA